MTTGFELILEYISNRTKEGDCITNLGNSEIQVGSDNSISTNSIFDGDDTLADSVRHIILMYYEDEQKHWEECGCPNNHIFKDLKLLKTLL